MPEFIMNTEGTVEGLEISDLSPFVQGYLEAMFFTNCDTRHSMVEWFESEEIQADLQEGRLDGDLPTDAGFGDIHIDILNGIVTDCKAFEQEARPLLSMAYARGYDREQAGRDFWYTRCGHGVGYWDRERLDADGLGDKLSGIARTYGDVYVSFEQDAESPTGYGYVYCQ